ncbi:MAG TPA: hypothetical protein VLB03_06265 [Nocardioidaceae bacterium]|nr:hypothetical protein [Nocardioidaceae bacterium]
MGVLELVWAIAGICALLLLPVGAMRMVAYRSGEVDHTSALRTVAVMALGIGGAAFVVFLVLSVWFLLTGDRPL